tara:strand:+ start:321 stop:686 length:366 start_codon:yes stop_codon:yes gene_type:complete
MTDNSTLIYKNVKVVKTRSKSSQLRGYPGDDTGGVFNVDSDSDNEEENYENEMVSDDEGNSNGNSVIEYSDERSECSTQCGGDNDMSDVEADDVMRLFKKRTHQREKLPSILKVETDFMDE